ncbi:MAG: hypothetical protein RL695_1579 [Pseudomonadota bacterium]
MIRIHTFAWSQAAGITKSEHANGHGIMPARRSDAVPALLFTLGTLVTLAASPALAQPDAGTLRQQIEQDQSRPLPRQALPIKPREPAPLKVPTGLSVTVKAFRFAGNTLMSAESLAPAVAPYLDRPIGLTDLQKAAAAVADIYRQSGWVVRVYLPQQDIENGIVTLQIVEAVFGGTHLEGTVPQRFSKARTIEIIEAAQAKGQNLNEEAIDRALLLIDDLPGVTATGKLRPGRSGGETELALTLGDEPLLRTEVGLNNTGSRGTGIERLLANLDINSPLALGDQLRANFVHTQGSDYLRLAASLPIGNDGWRVGANASTLTYHLVAPEFVALDGQGSSASAGLEASYPLIRSRSKNLYFNANADLKTFNNQANATTTTRYRSAALSLGLTGNLFDNLGGGGANSASLAFINGQLNLNDSPNQAIDAATTRTAGHYNKLRYAIRRQQLIRDDLSFFAALAGQMASKNLDSSEKFYLGGADGVRAYPANEGGGSEGQMLNLELRWKLPVGVTLVGFHDWGRIKGNVDNRFNGASSLNDFSLMGSGLALNWQGESGMSCNVTWARRQGENPNPSATGRDQDGSLVRNRLWLSILMPF